ncbi:MAG: nitrilase-related carbon-nitrogen hydrolase [Acidobacteriota bacterium]
MSDEADDRNILRLGLAQVAAGEEISANVERGLQWVERAAEAGCTLCCFPEMAFHPFFPQHRAEPRYFSWAEPIPGPITEAFQELADRHGIVVVVNLFELAGPGRHYDASPVIDADGSLVGVSRMVHIAEEPGFNERYYYWPGDGGFAVHATAAGPLGLAICYDRHFPEQLRALTIGGAEIILSPFAGTTDDPFEGYETEMRGAAFSNGVYIACCNRVGKEPLLTFAGRSFAVDPAGEVIARAGEEEELLVVEVDRRQVVESRQRRPFLRDRRPELYDVLSKR